MAKSNNNEELMGLPAGGMMGDLQQQLAELLLEEKLEARREKQRKLDQQRAFAETMAQQAKEEAAKKKSLQAGCNHLKQNGKTRVVGQSNSNLTATVLCQGCQKIWVNEGRGWVDLDGVAMPPQCYPNVNELGGAHGSFMIQQQSAA